MERTRAQLEELERLEYALASRIIHNPHWLPFESGISQKKRLRRREFITAQWDARLLLDRYAYVAQTISFPSEDDEAVDFESELAEIEDRYRHDAVFHPLARELEIGKKGLNRFKCAMTYNLEVDKIFSGPENYGSHIDFTRSYNDWRQLGYKTDYETFITSLGETIAGPEWFLDSLRQSVVDFWQKSHPLEKIPECKNYSDEELYCRVCDKKYASTGIYKAHLRGRKHQINSSRHILPVKHLIKVIKPEMDATVREISRRKAMTEQERHLEAMAIEHEIHEENVFESDVDDSSDNEGHPIMPLDPNGRPIPHWLYKLQGLGHIFPCEICGDKKYHGRKAFEKHFVDSEHAHGLRCLGITPSPAFNGIASINDAEKLWHTIQQNSLNAIGDTEREVEDEDGNVMSERVYYDLRRQGLI